SLRFFHVNHHILLLDHFLLCPLRFSQEFMECRGCGHDQANGLLLQSDGAGSLKSGGCITAGASSHVATKVMERSLLLDGIPNARRVRVEGDRTSAWHARTNSTAMTGCRQKNSKDCCGTLMMTGSAPVKNMRISDEN